MMFFRKFLTYTCFVFMIIITYVILRDLKHLTSVWSNGNLNQLITQQLSESNFKSSSHQLETVTTHATKNESRYSYLPGYRSPCWLESIEKSTSEIGDMVKFCGDLPGVYNHRYQDLCKRPIKDKMDDDKIATVTNTKECPDSPCRFRCLPSVYVAGFAKSGTTDMCSSLLRHPSINGYRKELYFWNQQRFMRNHSLGVFSSLFDDHARRFLSDSKLGKEGVLLECTSMTMHDNSHWTENQLMEGLSEPKRLTAHDIYETVPQSKFIVLLRNPTDRLYSHYNMFKAKSGGPERFHEQVLASIKWWKDCTETVGLSERRCLYGSPNEMPPMPLNVGNPKVWWQTTDYSEGIRIGMYALYLQDWLSVLPKDSFAFIKHEEYAKNKTHMLQNVIIPFIGLNSFSHEQIQGLEEAPIRNARHYSEQLPETRRILDEFYAPFNSRLADILGDDKWLWSDITTIDSPIIKS